MRLKGLALGRRWLRGDTSQVYRIMKVVDKVKAKQLLTKYHHTLELVEKLVGDF